MASPKDNLGRAIVFAMLVKCLVNYLVKNVWFAFVWLVSINCLVGFDKLLVSFINTCCKGKQINLILPNYENELSVF